MYLELFKKHQILTDDPNLIKYQTGLAYLYPGNGSMYFSSIRHNRIPDRWINLDKVIVPFYVSRISDLENQALRLLQYASNSQAKKFRIFRPDFLLMPILEWYEEKDICLIGMVVGNNSVVGIENE